MYGEELGDNLNEIGEIVARFSKMTEPIIKDFIIHQFMPGSSFLGLAAYKV